MPKDAKGRLKPGYEQHVFVCGHERIEGATRESCQNKNSLQLMKKLKHMAKDAGLKSIRVQKSGCLDFCENGPSCVVYPQGEWFTLTESKLETFLNYLKGGDLPSELSMKFED
ncbi:MAG: ferredoxin [Euryarchaeota archaeon]|nr:ferredoxin [Euryarchaeota archaeon]